MIISANALSRRKIESRPLSSKKAEAHKAPSEELGSGVVERFSIGAVSSVESTTGGVVNSKLGKVSAEILAQERQLGTYEHVPDQLMVRLRPSTSPSRDFVTEYGSKVLHTFDLSVLGTAASDKGAMMLLDLDSKLSVAEAMVLMQDDPRVDVVATNDILKSFGKESNPSQGSPDDLTEEQWGLKNTGQANGTAGVDIGAESAWQVTKGSRSGPIVAVIDSGVQVNHPDLAANIFTNTQEIAGDGIDNDQNGVVDDVHGYNAAADSGNPKDDNGHGTHVAGTVGAVGGNGKGVVGVSQEAQILPIRFLGEEGSGTTADSIKAVLYASKMGARITNNSWGGNQFNQLLFDVLADSPALHICAAGNEAYDNDLRPVYPASYELDNIVSVAAHDRNGDFPKFSNRGETTVDVAAPGVSILSTYKGGKYKLLDGTSMASPHVAGAAALIATEFPEITNHDLRFRLENNLEALPEKFGSRIVTGGRINVGLALEPDVLAPAQVDELQGEATSATQISLNWLATGDDAKEGRATAYDLRYTNGPLMGDGSSRGALFANASRIETNRPKNSGEEESVSFEVTPSGVDRTLSVGLQALDNVANRSELEVLKIQVPAAKVALEDLVDSNDESLFDLGEHWKKVTDADGRSVYTDSPDGDYPADREAVLTSKPFSLKGFAKPVLYFDLKHDVEQKHDEFRVEVEKDGWFGKSWKEVASFDGKSDWTTRKLDLTRFTGKDDVRIRFVMESDRDRNRDGVSLDNIVLADTP